MGIARSSVVCFVIDTTGSMYDDIVEARKLVHEIIDSKKGTQDEPSEYILVPFNDPGRTFILLLHDAESGSRVRWEEEKSLFCAFYADFGPMIRTTDPDKMKKEVNALRPTGGGDTPEMCLSGLQVHRLPLAVSFGLPTEVDLFPETVSAAGTHGSPGLFQHLRFY